MSHPRPPFRPYPLPPNEDARLAEVERLRVLDTDPEEAFDRFARIATRVFRTPIALVTIVGAHHQSFKACYGVDARGTDREISFCTHALAEDRLMVVPDATVDPRFRTNPLVDGPLHVRFYAGAPLRTRSGEALGTLCVLDRRPRPDFGTEEAELLQELADAVVHALELRLHYLALERERVRERTRAQWARDRGAILLRISRHDPVDTILSDLALPSSLHPDEGPASFWLRQADGWRRVGGGTVPQVDEPPRAVAEAVREARASGPIPAAETIANDDASEPGAGPTGPDGEPYAFALIEPVSGAEGEPTGALVRFGNAAAFDDPDVRRRQQDVAWLASVALQQAELIDQLRRHAFYDGLTGLPNRQLLADRLRNALRRAERAGGRATVLFLDLDGFKEINDRYGHATGDGLLRAIAERLTEVVRDQETLARIGGDEFVIVVDGPDDDAAERSVEERVRAAFAAPFRVGAHEVRIRPSVGAARWPHEASDADGLLSLADTRMYRVKRVARGEEPGDELDDDSGDDPGEDRTPDPEPR